MIVWDTSGFFFEGMSERKSYLPDRTLIKTSNGPFSQDCDDVFNSHQYRKSSGLSYFDFQKNECTFITLYFVLYHLCIKLQKTKIKLVNANARVFLMKHLWEGR